MKITTCTGTNTTNLVAKQHHHSSFVSSSSIILSILLLYLWILLVCCCNKNIPKSFVFVHGLVVSHRFFTKRLVHNRYSILLPVQAASSRREVLSTITFTTGCVTTRMSSSSTTNTVVESNNKQQQQQDLFWNREYGTKDHSFDPTLPIVRNAKIVCLSDPNDTNNRYLYGPEQQLPDGCEILHVGTQDVNIQKMKEMGCNVIFVSDGKHSRDILKELIIQLGSQLLWIHSRSAGIDTFYSDTIQTKFRSGIMTNSKGQFSSTLAEYTMAACLYFAKDLPKLLNQKNNKEWNPYPILELRGSTMGIVGYGDIGKAAARLGLSFGMNIIALTRQPTKSNNNDDSFYQRQQQGKQQPFIKMYDTQTTPNALNILFSESDYILVATPLTNNTLKMIGKEQFEIVKEGAVLINVGRGPVIDEEALIDALQQYSTTGSSTKNRRLKGAALDVTTIEPLLSHSPLWKLENVLLSPHNMDMTTSFMVESADFFRKEQLPRFIRNVPLLNPVNIEAGY